MSDGIDHLAVVRTVVPEANDYPDQVEAINVIRKLAEEVERLRAALATACDVLQECHQLLWKHHEAKVAAWFAETSRCPVCSYGGTQTYPNDIFGRIKAARAAGGGE